MPILDDEREESSMTNSPLVLSLPPERKGEAYVSFVVFALFIVVILGVVVAKWQGFQTLGQKVALAYFLLMVIFGPFYIYRALMRARRTGWWDSRFELSPESIKHVLPSGDWVIGRWEDLTYVSPRKHTLYFADGTVMRLNYGPMALWRYAEFSPEELQTTLSASGEESLMSKAYHEFFEAKPSKALLRFSQAIQCLILFPTMVAAMFVYKELEEPLNFLVFSMMWVAGMLPLIVVTTLPNKKERAVD